MKHLLIVALIFCAQLSFGQNRKEVEAEMEKFRTALLAEDAETLREMTSEDLVYVHSSGLAEDQRAFLKVFESKTQDYQVWDTRDTEITFHRNNTAMVRQMVHLEIKIETKVNILELGLLMVWLKEEGDWKLLARQGFRIPQN